MPNEKNLIPNRERTPSERRRNAKKAGKASGESRRKRKALKDSMNYLLSLPIKDQKEVKRLEALGIPEEEIDNSQLIVLALFLRAKTGDVAAIKELRNLIGEDESIAGMNTLTVEDDPITAAIKEEVENGLI